MEEPAAGPAASSDAAWMLDGRDAGLGPGRLPEPERDVSLSQHVWGDQRPGTASSEWRLDDSAPPIGSLLPEPEPEPEPTVSQQVWPRRAPTPEALAFDSVVDSPDMDQPIIMVDGIKRPSIIDEEDEVPVVAGIGLVSPLNEGAATASQVKNLTTVAKSQTAEKLTDAGSVSYDSPYLEKQKGVQTQDTIPEGEIMESKKLNTPSIDISSCETHNEARITDVSNEV